MDILGWLAVHGFGRQQSCEKPNVQRADYVEPPDWWTAAAHPDLIHLIVATFPPL